MVHPRTKWRNARIAVGKCPNCGGIPDGESKLCIVCKKKANDAKKADVARWKKEGICQRCGRNKAIQDRSLCVGCHIKNARAGKLRSIRLKLRVLQAYGLRCRCCGSEVFEHLTIDHIDSNGTEHRRELGLKAGKAFYQWLTQNDFPDGFQTMCASCNLAKGIYGECPCSGGKRDELVVQVLAECSENP